MDLGTARGFYGIYRRSRHFLCFTANSKEDSIERLSQNTRKALFVVALIVFIATELLASPDWPPPYELMGWHCSPAECDEDLLLVYSGEVSVDAYGDCINGYPLTVGIGVDAYNCFVTGPVSLNARVSLDRQYQQIGGFTYPVDGLAGVAQAWDRYGILYWSSYVKDYCSSYGGDSRLQDPTPC